MKDYILIANLLMLVLNVGTFIYLMNADKIYLRLLRVILIVVIFIGTLSNLGKLTLWNVLFAFTPFITLIKINPHGKINRIAERIRGSGRTDKQYVQGVQGGAKALPKQKT